MENETRSWKLATALIWAFRFTLEYGEVCISDVVCAFFIKLTYIITVIQHLTHAVRTLLCVCECVSTHTSAILYVTRRILFQLLVYVSIILCKFYHIMQNNVCCIFHFLACRKFLLANIVDHPFSMHVRKGLLNSVKLLLTSFLLFFVCYGGEGVLFFVCYGGAGVKN